MAGCANHDIAPASRFGSPATGWFFRAPIDGVLAKRGVAGQVQVLVRDNNVDQALKALKKKMQREGIFREMKLRRHFEKPSERRAREAAEAVRRARKMERKRLEREGF
jgi:small subunit ribosomal protein S21